MNLKVIIAFLLMVLAMPNLIPAQTTPAPGQKPPDRFVYEWTDSNGVVHMTDDPSQVPTKYQNENLKKRAVPRSEELPGQPQGGAVRPAPGSTTRQSDQEFEQNLRTDEWRQRYLSWKAGLQRSEKKLQSLQQRRADLITQWGSVAVAPPAVREAVAQVDQDLQNTQAEIDEARHMLDDVLPDEARKAGIPPGSLRE